MAVYLSPDHPDLLDFLDLRRPGGDENMRCRDLFLALWVSDLFMQRVENDQMWSFFDPSQCPGLADAWGPAYQALYTRYESEGRYTKQLPARDVWTVIVRSQIESGVPYILYKDSANAKSNQQNLGTIRCSNLCAEILEYTSKDEVSVCNLASISLPAFVKNGAFDFKDLYSVVKVAARNLDSVIDLNEYPIEEAQTSNTRHRPVGLGVQGLHDVYMMLRLPFTSIDAQALNERIFATIYYAAIETSCELAKELGPYSTFDGSPASQGKLQYDLWGVSPLESPELNWAALKAKIAKHGLRNSLSVAIMPTASTAQVMGNTESVEPVTSLLYVRRTLAGEFTVLNKHLVSALMDLGIWSTALKDSIIRDNGSIQNIPSIPQDLKDVFATAFDMSAKHIIDQAAARGPYICQTQSMNVFMAQPTFSKITSMLFYAHKKGLKTGLYYLRTRPASFAKMITVDVEKDGKEQCVHCTS